MSTNPTTTLLVLPEVWNSPYATSSFPSSAEPCPTPNQPQSDLDPKTSPSSTLLSELAKHHNVHIIGGSIPEFGDDGSVYNTCLVYSPTGLCIARHRKVHLFDIDVPGGITFKESDTLTPGNQLITTFPHPTLGTVGVGICYDIRFPELFLLHALRKTDVFVLPGAFNLTTGPKHWELLLRARAVDMQGWVIAASPARATKEMIKENENGEYPTYEAWGHSMAVDPWGGVMVEAGVGEEGVGVEVELERGRKFREAIPTGRQKRTDLYKIEEV